MGARGPAAKPKEQRRNRNAKPAGEVEVAATVPAKFKAPAIPDGDWSPEVRRWWTAWATTPAAVQFSSTEWERLFRALPLCAAYWRAVAVRDKEPPGGSVKELVEWIAATTREVRDAHTALLNAEKGLPATDYERRRSGIQVKPAPAPAPAGPAPAGEVRRLKVV